MYHRKQEFGSCHLQESDRNTAGNIAVNFTKVHLVVTRKKLKAINRCHGLLKRLPDILTQVLQQAFSIRTGFREDNHVGFFFKGKSANQIRSICSVDVPKDAGQGIRQDIRALKSKSLSEQRGVEAITGNAVVAGGETHELDCLIFATGFETATDYSKRSGFQVIGVGGQTLHDKWTDGMVSLHGMHSRGFPNCFVLSQSQSGMSVNFPHMIDEQSKHLAYIVGESEKRGIETVEATLEAEQQWVQAILDLSEGRRKFLEQCTPGFYNNEGVPSAAASRNLPFAPGPVAFVDVLRQWRAKDDLDGLELDGDHALAVKEDA